MNALDCAEGDARPAARPAGSPARAARACGALALLVVLVAMSGCASAPQHRQPLEDTGPTAVRADPWERLNRRIYAFNDVVDQAIVKPVALGYRAVVPEWMRTGIGNMFGNLGDAWAAVNLLLQGRPQAAVETGWRVTTNTVFGLLGFIDIAEEMGLERRNEDFGQTLGRWGLKSGPYLVLPLLGPSTLRDTAALALIDWRASPPRLGFGERRDRNGATVLQLVDARVKLLNASRVLDDIALDKYVFVRDAYLARRRSQVYDGLEPDDEEDGGEPAPVPAPK